MEMERQSVINFFKFHQMHLGNLAMLFSILILLFPNNTITAQDQPYELFGVVVDKYTQEPLAGANIIEVSDQFYGVASDIEGLFTLRLDSFPRKFRIQYLGYEDYLLEIFSDYKDEYIIEMIPSISTLPGATVTNKVIPDTVFNEGYSVVDYAFHENYIFLLAYKNALEKYTLIALDQNDKIFNTLGLDDRRPVELFKSCSDELYLITEVNAHQIEITEFGLRFREQLKTADFESYINPCVVSTQDHVVFSRYFYQGQALEYNVFTNVGIENKTRIAFIEDGPNIERLFEDAGVKKPWSGDNWETNTTDEIAELRDSPYELEGMMRIFYPKLYAPLFCKDNNFVMFDHQNNRIDHLTPTGELIKRAEINYPNNKKWKKKIYFDPKLQKAHTSFHTQWGEEICPINLNTGEVGKGILLDMAFIDNVKAWNGYLYFIFKDSFRNQYNNRLYKIPLNSY